MSEGISPSHYGDDESVSVSSIELTTVRDLVDRGSNAAEDHVAQLRKDLDIFTARAKLLVALIEATAGKDNAREHVLEAIKGVQAFALSDSETLTDVAFGRLVIDRPRRAAAVLLDSIEAMSTTAGVVALGDP